MGGGVIDIEGVSVGGGVRVSVDVRDWDSDGERLNVWLTVSVDDREGVREADFSSLAVPL